MTGPFDGFDGESVEVPDLPAPIVAYRVWHAVPTMPALLSFNLLSWLDGEIEARCIRFGHTNDVDPRRFLNPCGESPCPPGWIRHHNGHGCGVYAFKSVETLLARQHTETGLVLGVVELWGKVYEHAEGYRAEHARVVGIFEPNGNANRDARMVAARLGLDLLPWPPEVEYPGYCVCDRCTDDEREVADRSRQAARLEWRLASAENDFRTGVISVVCLAVFVAARLRWSSSTAGTAVSLAAMVAGVAAWVVGVRTRRRLDREEHEHG